MSQLIPLVTNLDTHWIAKGMYSRERSVSCVDNQSLYKGVIHEYNGIMASSGMVLGPSIMYWDRGIVLEVFRCDLIDYVISSSLESSVVNYESILYIANCHSVKSAKSAFSYFLKTHSVNSTDYANCYKKTYKRI